MKKFSDKIIESGTLLTVFIALIVLSAFVSNLASSRVLGISLLKDGNINTYVESGGFFILQTFQALYSFPFQFKYLNINTLLFCLLIGNAIFLITIILLDNKKSKLLKTSIQISTFSLSVLYLIFLVNIYQPIYETKSVIYPITTNEKKILFNAKEYENKSFYSDYYKEKFRTCEKQQNQVKCLFNLQDTYVEANDQKNTYITLVQITMVSLSIFIGIIYLVKKYLIINPKYLLIPLFIYQLISLTYAHGVIGVTYDYPVFNIKLVKNKKESKVKSYKRLILLKETNNTLYLLDRNNYFSIYRINTKKIDSLIQIDQIPLFINCSEKAKRIKLCENMLY